MNRRLKCVLALCLLLPPSAVSAQEDAKKAEGQVAEIKIEGLRRVEREAALTGLKTAVGAPLDAAKLSQDLKTVWKTGLFRDVRVEKESLSDGRVRVVFIVQEKPSIKEVKYSGNSALSADDIKAVVDVKPYTILNIELLKKNVEKIKDLYVQKGYYLATIAYHTEAVQDSEAEVRVVFDIVENAKVVVKQITLIGNKHLSDDAIKSVLQTREGSELSFLTQSGTYKEDFFQTDLLRIQALYYDAGYVTIKVGEPSATISSDRRFIYLSVPIEEGEKYSIGTIQFSGDVELKNDAGEVIVDEEELRDKLSVAPGETFNRTKLFQDIQNLTDAYRDQGYAYANVTPNSNINDKTRVVNLDMQVERGEMVYFERIEIAGNTRTRDKVIRRELLVTEGERYSGKNINDSKARVTALGYFETVNLTTSRGSKPNLMNVAVEIKEKSTGTFQVGAGFSSVENFILTAQIAQNNFLGNGWLLSLQAQLSTGQFARRLATLQFYDPYFLDSKWSLGFDAYSTQRYYRDFARNSLGLSPRLGYPITYNWRLSCGYTLEEINLSTNLGAFSTAPSLYNLNRNGINSALSTSLIYDSRDNRLFPSAGMYHTVSGEVSDAAIGSNSALQYRRMQFLSRFYRPLPLGLVLKFNVEFGWVFGGGAQGVPISERYFPGGIFSVRGFNPRGLGPTILTLAEGKPGGAGSSFIIGGNKQAIFNLELEFPLLAAAGIKGVLFADAGNAYNDDQNFFYIDTPKSIRSRGYKIGSGREVIPPLGLYYSFGWGFRWFSPIGPLRFEWGVPIVKRAPGDRGMLFEFTIGNMF